MRLGVSVLFEELKANGEPNIDLAIPALVPLLAPETPAYVRGEAAGVLGIIGSDEPLAALKPLINDNAPQKT